MKNILTAISNHICKLIYPNLRKVDMRNRSIWESPTNFIIREIYCVVGGYSSTYYRFLDGKDTIPSNTYYWGWAIRGICCPYPHRKFRFLSRKKRFRIIAKCFSNLIEEDITNTFESHCKCCNKSVIDFILRYK